MATLYISEYAGIGMTQASDGPYRVPTQGPTEPRLTAQVISITGSPTSSAAFQNNPGVNGGITRLIRVHTDAICSIQIGANPTAVTTEGRMAANQTEYFNVLPGHKISVISNV